MNNLLMYAPLLVQLSDKEKKTIGILAAVILCVFLLLGLLAKLLVTIKNREGEKIDAYMYDLVSYGIIEKPSQFRRYVFKRENKNMYLKNRWYIRIGILVGILFVIYVSIVLKGDYTTIGQIIKDFFIKIEWKLFSSNEGTVSIQLLPKIIKQPIIHLVNEEGNFYLTGYVTYFIMAVAIVIIIRLIISSFSFFARISRCNKMATKAFGKSLDNLANGFKKKDEPNQL